MKVPKKIKEMPWPEEYHGGNQNFRVTMRWPVIDHERYLVATFDRNLDKKSWFKDGRSFRLICSKKQRTAAVQFKGEARCTRKTLSELMYANLNASPGSCYPEISPAEEKTLREWLGKKNSRNHFMPEFAEWVGTAVQSEKQKERDARGEIRDEDVGLCPDDVPPGLVDYIRRVMIPDDKVLLYKKGNMRGRCFRCGEMVTAKPYQRFRQNEIKTCPNCGQMVDCHLQDGASFSANYLNNVATIQPGTDGETVFVRHWHVMRDPSARWDRVEDYLEEVARYAIRGTKTAKWQHEVKERWGCMMNPYREKTKDWMRMRDPGRVYDGPYYFYLPTDWRDMLAGTSLHYCELAEYCGRKTAHEGSMYHDQIRFMEFWVRYPAFEKLWKAGYKGLVEDRVAGIVSMRIPAMKGVLNWSAKTIQQAIGMPYRLLKLRPAEGWRVKNLEDTAKAWRLVEAGKIREAEIPELVECGIGIGFFEAALGHASASRILRYLKQYDGQHLTYRDYLRDCETLGLDLNDRAVLFPRDLRAAHQRTIAAVKYKVDQEAKRKFMEHLQEIKSMEWAEGGLLIRLPTKPEELIAEGEALHHCVGGYVGKMANGETTILLIRKAEAPETPFFTLEYQRGRIVQCRTSHNESYEKHPEIKDFVNQWLTRMKRKNKQKAAEVA